MLRKDGAFVKCGLRREENAFCKMRILSDLTGSDSAAREITAIQGEGRADTYLCDYKERALAVKTSQGITAVETSCEQDGRLKLQTMSEG